MTDLVHATAVASWSPTGWNGALLAGLSGAGKSGLALRLLHLGWRLVGDDYVEVWASDGSLYARAPERITGLIEARGVGLVPARCLELARIALHLEGRDGEPDRMPQAASKALCGLSIPSLALDFHHPSAPAKVARALSALGQRSRLS